MIRPPLGIFGRSGARHQEGAAQVDGHLPVEMRKRHGGERGLDQDARIVHEHVDARHARERGRDEAGSVTSRGKLRAAKGSSPSTSTPSALQRRQAARADAARGPRHARPPSPWDLPAVDAKRLARDVGGAGRRRGTDRRPAMSAGSISPPGRACAASISARSRLPGVPVRAARTPGRAHRRLGPHPARGDRVHRDAARPELLRPGLGEADHGVLRGDVGAEERLAHAPPDRGGVDDPPARPHRREGLRVTIAGADHVDVDDAAEQRRAPRAMRRRPASSARGRHC